MLAHSDFEWQKSPAHLRLLSAFLIPRTLGDIPDDEDWNMVLGEDIQSAVSRFVTKGFIEPCDLSIQLERKFKKTELQSLCREGGLNVSGCKDKLANRLIQENSESMKQLLRDRGLEVLQCTVRGEKIAQEYLNKGIQATHPENAVSPENFGKAISWVSKEALEGVIGATAISLLQSSVSMLRKSKAIKKKEELPEPKEKPLETPVIPDYFAQGKMAFDLGDYKRAIVDYTKAIELSPRYAEAYNNRGIAYRRMREYKKAIADYNEAIDLNPRYAEAYNNRGVAYEYMGEYKKAIADYNEAIKLNPQFADPYNNRGIAYEYTGEYKKAIPDYNEAIKLNPQFADPYNNRGIAYEHTGEYKKAIADYNKAIKVNPQYAEAYNNRGIAYEHMGEYKKAIADYNKAIKLNPQYAEAYNNRGNVYGDMGEYNQAITDYNKAIKLNPRYAEAYIHRAGLLINKWESTSRR